MRCCGFDFEAGRLDVSTHPFSGGVPEDVRLTTRYREDDFVRSLMGTIHETGHGRYEQNLPRDVARPAGRARRARWAIHESQSLSFEMQLGAQPRASSACSRRCSPRHFGAQPAFEADNLHRLLTRVEPRPHPRRRRRGDLSGARDPALRDRARADRGRDRGRGHPGAVGREDGGAARARHARQLHATAACRTCTGPRALFGYFPCYTLGAMYAAQWFAAMRRARARPRRRASPRRPRRRCSTGCARTSGCRRAATRPTS